jgi:hypothetical protein
MEDDAFEKKLKQKARVRRQKKRKVSVKSGTLSQQVKKFSGPKNKPKIKVKLLLK